MRDNDFMQMNLFNFNREYKKINKTVRLIEFFSGLGAQARGLEILGIPFEHYKTCEWAAPSIEAYNAIHLKDWTDYSKGKTKEELIQFLDGNISTNYDEPCNVHKKNEEWLRKVYNNCIATHNLMNIMKVHGEDLEIEETDKYEAKLTELGYTNFVGVLNAKNYGIPQNRRRCFMLSIYGDYSYDLPKATPLKYSLKDLLEENVDRKYYLTEKALAFFESNSEKQKRSGNGYRFSPITATEKSVAKTVTTKSGSRMDDNFIKIKNATKQGYLEAEEGDGVDISTRMEKHRGTVQKGLSQTLTCAGGQT